MADFKFPCPDCGQRIQCDTSYCGSQINCPVCNQTIVVPKSGGKGKTPIILVALILSAIAAGAGLFLFLKPTPRAGLVALWKAEGNAKDSIGHHNGTLRGDVGFAQGQIGKAFLFNTPDAAVKIPPSPKLNVGAGDGFTLEAWINPSDVSMQHPVVVVSGNSLMDFCPVVRRRRPRLCLREHS
jgi:ribosomal protein S27E